MPLTVGGSASYNMSNIAGAALAALALGIPPATVAHVLARFGADPADNPGRLMRYDYRGAQVLDGLRAQSRRAERAAEVCAVSCADRATRAAARPGRQSRNADIERLAATAARFRPDFVVIKETENYCAAVRLAKCPPSFARR